MVRLRPDMHAHLGHTTGTSTATEHAAATRDRRPLLTRSSPADTSHSGRVVLDENERILPGNRGWRQAEGERCLGGDGSVCRCPERAARRGSRSRAALLAALAGCRQPPVDQACQGDQQASCISWHAWGRGSSAGEGARWRAERPSEQTLATGSRGRGLRRGGRGAHPQEKSPNSSRLTGDAKNPEAGAEKVVDLAHPRAVMKVEVGGLCTGVSQSEG